VCGNVRPRIVFVGERDALGGAAGGRADAVDLRLAGAIRREVDVAAVGRPGRFRVDGRRIGDARQMLVAEVEDVDLRVAAVAAQGEREPAAVGRPGRRAVDARAHGDAG